MADVFEYGDPEGSKLTDADKLKIKRLIAELQGILPKLRSPVDPKVYPLIETSAEMLIHQLEMELHFTYDDGIFEDIDTSDVTPEEVEEAVKQVKKERAEKEKKKPPAKKKAPEKKTKAKKAPPEKIVNEVPTADDLASWFEQEGPDIE
jgi:outer membrane biosynthesis protein TonB